MSGSAAPGRVVDGYVLDTLLGSTHGSAVWRAYRADDPKTLFALKLFTNQDADFQPVQHEVVGSAAGSSRTLVGFVSANATGEGTYLVLEYVDGMSLSTLIARLGAQNAPPSPALVAHLGVELARALETESGQYWQHLHLSPHNVLLHEDGRVRLSDLGITAAESFTNPKNGLRLRGRAAYLSPEQLNGGAVDQRSDLFSLGALLYETAKLRPLFAQRALPHTIDSVLDRDVKPLTESILGFPKALSEVIGRLLERDPARRFSTAREAANALDEAGRDLPGYGEAEQKLGKLLSKPTFSAPTQQPAAAPFGHAGLPSSAARAERPMGAGRAEASLVARTPSVLREWLQDPDALRWVVIGLGAAIVVLGGIFAFSGQDDGHDVELRGLYDRSEYVQAEAYFVAHVDDFAYPKAAFELATDARARNLGWSVPGRPPLDNGETEAPAAPETETDTETETASETETEVEAAPEAETAPAAPAAPANRNESGIVPPPNPTEPSGLKGARRRSFRAAEQAYLKGKRLLESGDAEAAAEAFTECSTGFELAVCHLQLGLAFDQLSRTALAVRHYDRYLLLVPRSDQRVAIEQRIRALEGR